MFGAASADPLSIPTPPTLVGLFFCLASAEGAGLLFCPAAMQPHTSVYRAFCVVHAVYRPRRKTTHMALQALFLLFALFCRRCVAGASAYTAPSAPRWSVSQRRCTGQRNRPIIIRYIRVQRCAPLLWIHARQCSISQTMPARRGLDASHTWHGISLALAWHGSAEPLAAAAVSLFGLSPDSQ